MAGDEAPANVLGRISQKDIRTVRRLCYTGNQRKKTYQVKADDNSNKKRVGI